MPRHGNFVSLILLKPFVVCQSSPNIRAVLGQQGGRQVRDGLVREHLLEVRPRAAPAPRQEVDEREAEAVLDRRQILPELPCRPSHNLLASRYVYRTASRLSHAWFSPSQNYVINEEQRSFPIHASSFGPNLRYFDVDAHGVVPCVPSTSVQRMQAPTPPRAARSDEPL